MKDGHKSINQQLREARGVTVDGYSAREEHKGLNAYIRKAAARNTWTQELGTGKITHVNGEPVSQGEGRG